MQIISVGTLTIHKVLSVHTSTKQTLAETQTNKPAATSYDNTLISYRLHVTKHYHTRYKGC